MSVSDVSNVPMTTATAADPVRDIAEAVVTDYESDTSSVSSVPVKRPHTSFSDQGVTSDGPRLLRYLLQLHLRLSTYLQCLQCPILFAR